MLQKTVNDFTLLLWLVLLVSCATLGISHSALADSLVPSRDIITVPYEENASGKPLVFVPVNKTISAKFLLDTGTTLCFLSEHLADQLKLSRSPSMNPNGKPSLNNGVTFDNVHVDDMALGDFHVSGSFGVAKRTQIDLNQDGAEGIIGVNVLKDKALVFYPSQHLLYIYVSGNLSANEATIAGFGPTAHRIPIVWDTADNIYRCAVIVAGPQGISGYSPVLDTGADMTNITSNAADAVGLVPFGVNQTTMFNRQFEARLAHVAFLRIG